MYLKKKKSMQPLRLLAIALAQAGKQREVPRVRRRDVPVADEEVEHHEVDVRLEGHAEGRMPVGDHLRKLREAHPLEAGHLSPSDVRRRTSSAGEQRSLPGCARSVKSSGGAESQWHPAGGKSAMVDKTPACNSNPTQSSEMPWGSSVHEGVRSNELLNCFAL